MFKREGFLTRLSLWCYPFKSTTWTCILFLFASPFPAVLYSVIFLPQYLIGMACVVVGLGFRIAIWNAILMNKYTLKEKARFSRLLQAEGRPKPIETGQLSGNCFSTICSKQYHLHSLYFGITNPAVSLCSCGLVIFVLGGSIAMFLYWLVEAICSCTDPGSYNGIGASMWSWAYSSGWAKFAVAGMGIGLFFFGMQVLRLMMLVNEKNACLVMRLSSEPQSEEEIEIARVHRSIATEFE